MGSATEDGQIPMAEGSFYSFQNGKVTKHLSDIGISNGLAFDTDLNKFYYVDSFKGSLDQYDFDVKKGTISNGKAIYTVFEKYDPNKDLDTLDGMAIDADGNLWVAIFSKGQVRKIDPRKPETVIETIEFPAKQITSVAFGGANLDEMYVTSGRLTLKGMAPLSPEDGSLYRVRGLNNVKGLLGERIVL